MKTTVQQICGNKDIIETAKVYAKVIGDHYFELGALFSEIKNKELYHKVENGKYIAENHKLWRDFCNDYFKDTSYRVVQYWINVYEYFNSFNMDKEDLEGIGWSKAKELVGLTDYKDILDEFIEYAKNNTLEALKDKIRKFKDDKVEKIPTHQKLVIKIPLSVKEAIDEVLVYAYESLEVSPENAVAEIILDWYNIKAAQLSIENNFTEAA